jgi:hypothetical protein
MSKKTTQRADPAPKTLTFIDALNDPDLRRLIDNIDDIWASLYHGERREPVLEGLLASEVFLLRTRGFDYDPRTLKVKS